MSKQISLMDQDKEQEIIKFYRANNKDYGFLSNLYKQSLVFENVVFPTAEHAYQYGKFRDEEVKHWAMMAPKPHLLAILAHGLFSWDIVKDWSKIKVDRMYEVLEVKFSEPELREKLLATDNAILIEDSKTDSFWGIGKSGKGKNMLGKLLMKVRKELKKQAINKTVVLPITICGFKKTKSKIGYPCNLYNSKRIKGFTNKYGGNYIILSRKYGLMFSERKYRNYEDSEMVSDEELLKILKKQSEMFPELKLFNYNPRPLTGTKWFEILKKAGFNVKEYRKLEEFDLEQYIHFNELENYNEIEYKIKQLEIS